MIIIDTSRTWKPVTEPGGFAGIANRKVADADRPAELRK